MNVTERGISTAPPIETILTDRLLLKVITPEAAAYAFNHESDEAIRKMFGITTDADFARLRARFTSGVTEYISFRLFLIHDRDTLQFMGSCNYHTWQIPHSRAEIGYMIQEEFRNKGFTREAMRTVLMHGFEQMGLNRVEALIGPTNTPSLKLVARFGFTREGLLREHYCRNGKVEDSIFFSLLKREYESLKDNW